MAATLEDLARRIDAIPGRRILVALVGPPASGKSTLADTLAARVGGAVLPMDGFHLDDRILAPRGLLPRKGAPDTIDLGGLTRTLAALRGGGDVVHPVFDRSREIAVAGAGIVDARTRVVVVEGNWLLLDAPGWRDLVWDCSARLEVDDATLRARLEARWADLDLSSRVAKIDGNDMPNARLVRTGSRPADVVLHGV